MRIGPITVEDFVKEIIQRYRDLYPGVTDAQIAESAKTKWNNIRRWQLGPNNKDGSGILIGQLDSLLRNLLGFGLDRCLWFPDEVTEWHRFEVAYSKSRAAGVNDKRIAAALPVQPIVQAVPVANSSSKTSEPVKFTQKPKARKAEPLRTKVQVANVGRKKRDGP